MNNFRKKLIYFLFITALFFTSCSEADVPVRLLNADNLEGAELPSYNTMNNTANNTTPSPESVLPIQSTAAIETTKPETISQTLTTTIITEATAVAATTAAATTAATTPPATTMTTTVMQEDLTPATATTTASTTTVKREGSAPTGYVPLNYSEVRGVWISYIELQVAFAGKTEDSFRKSFSAMLDNCQKIGINTVYVHLIAFGDAFYSSKLFPWSKYTSGSSSGIIGENPGFDPLKIMLDEAHSRKISFHGWLNPMRLMSDTDMGKISAEFPVAQWYKGSRKGTYIVKNGDFWYLNPAYEEVRKLIADGAKEVLANYNMDGLHIDDYFYPPNCPDNFDSEAFTQSGFSTRSQFRLDNCTKMVKELYDTVKSVNSFMLFGISPQGSIGNCYNIYADVKLWGGNAGYCDYIAPQIYYGFNNAAQPFDKCLSEWEELVFGSKVNLIIGLAVYKIGYEDAWAGVNGKNEWIASDDILKRQVDLSKSAKNYGGIIFFSYRFMMGLESNAAQVNAQLAKIS